MINFRYNILRKLGEGGTGAVYLVEDTLKQGRQSAMKILHRLDQGQSAVENQFRNEMSVLATLHHPNLVRVFDSGIVRHTDDPFLVQCRFFTMEYVQGRDALQWFRGLGNEQERVEQLRQLVLQALGVLTYIHQQGVVHFDIKPENLLLIGRGKDGGPPLLKLTDFGFSVKEDDRSQLPLRGTLEYTAPELLQRNAFDHRIDLYSLGATLYHVIEGHAPHEATEPVELIKRVLTTTVEFQQLLHQPYEPFLTLVRRLLEKDPERRLSSAKDAAKLFVAGSEESGGGSFELSAKPAFVGRNAEKQRIAKAIDHLGGCKAGDAGEIAFVISGTEGIGKTALLSEMTKHARGSDIAVLEMTSIRSDVPFGAVRSFLGLLKAEVMSRSAGRSPLIGKYTKVIDDGVGEGNGRRLQSDWVREKEKVIEAQAQFTIASAMSFPFIIVIDDADQLDEESLEVIRVCVRDATPGRLLLLATEKGQSLSLPRVVRFQLEELDGAGVNAMSSNVFGSSLLATTVGNRLFQLYGGYPNLIVEALHSVEALLPLSVPSVQSEVFAFVESVFSRLPRDIDQFLVNRYQSLDRGKQLTLEILSCFRFPSLLDIIQSVLPFQHQRASEYLSSLEAGGFVALHEAGRRFSMRHAKLKTIVYSGITQSRQDVHLFIASALEQRRDLRSFNELQELAFQYTEGGRYPESMRWLESAADEGMAIAAFRRARELYEEAVLLGTDTGVEALGELKVKLSRAMFQSGEYRKVIELVGQLLEDPMNRSHTFELHKTAGLAHSKLGGYEQARTHIGEALLDAVDMRDRLELQQEMVGIDIALGNAIEAERASILQLDLARQLGDRKIIASIYTDLGISTFFQDLFDRSVGYFQDAMELYSEDGQHARLADAMMNVGNVMSAKGDTITAIETWGKALSISQEYGTLNQQGQIQNNLGIAHYKLKRFGEAKSFYGNARRIFERIESKQGVTFVLTNFGEVCFAECEYEKSLRLWEEALALYRTMDDARGLTETFLQLAQVRQILGDKDAVVRDLDSAEALMDEKGLDTFRPLLLYHRGVLMISRGQYVEASETLRRGTELLGVADEERKLLLQVRRAESDYRLGMIESAVTACQHALRCAEKTAISSIIAESSFLLGMIAKTSPASVQERSFVLFKKGMDAIAGAPITELTWRIAFALGQEYHERGQEERAREFLSKARLVLQFIATRFESDELKREYLAVEKKDRVLVTLEQFLNN